MREGREGTLLMKRGVEVLHLFKQSITIHISESRGGFHGDGEFISSTFFDGGLAFSWLENASDCFLDLFHLELRGIDIAVYPREYPIEVEHGQALRLSNDGVKREEMLHQHMRRHLTLK